MTEKEPAQVDIAYTRLRSMIIDGELSQGEELKERQLADTVGTSRTPVREAISLLIRDGLAERANRRVRVTRWDEEKVGQLYELRGVLESEATRLAAMRRSPHMMRRLADALTQQRELRVDSPTQRRQLNYEFHQLIWSASANPLLVEANEKYGIQSYSLNPTSLRSAERWAESIQDHARIVELIDAQRPEQAAAAMAEHLRGGYRNR